MQLDNSLAGRGPTRVRPNKISRSFPLRASQVFRAAPAHRPSARSPAEITGNPGPVDPAGTSSQICPASISKTSSLSKPPGSLAVRGERPIPHRQRHHRQETLRPWSRRSARGQSFRRKSRRPPCAVEVAPSRRWAGGPARVAKGAGSDRMRRAAPTSRAKSPLPRSRAPSPDGPLKILQPRRASREKTTGPCPVITEVLDTFSRRQVGTSSPPCWQICARSTAQTFRALPRSGVAAAQRPSLLKRAGMSSTIQRFLKMALRVQTSSRAANYQGPSWC